MRVGEFPGRVQFVFQAHSENAGKDQFSSKETDKP